ncbi:MAG: D-alanyl-D-alanine carboxypeptidase/D-alanyl-D-alanine endopeptidase [Gemmatimonadales bacterium]
MTRRLVPALVALIIASAPLPAQSATAITPVLDGWWARTSHRSPGTWGVVVADQNGKVLWQVNDDEPMIPASTVKVLTTGFARTAVGGDARRATRVVGNGHVDPGTGMWVGQWGLELNGDPTLERPDRTGPTLLQLAQQLSAIGVRKLVGPLDVTTGSGVARSTYPAVWADRFRGRLYAPPIGPITLNENVVFVTVGPGARAGSRAVIIGDAPTGVSSLVEVTATTVAGRRTRLHFGALKNGHWIVSGKIGLHGAPRQFRAVSTDPTAVLEAAWRHATAAAGIEWTRASAMSAAGPAVTHTLAEVASETFDSIAHEVNTRSLNIGAEMMLLWGGGGISAPAQLTTFVRKITGLDGVHLVDGSGLSEQDRVAPIVFTTYLARIPQTPAGRNFPLLFPANGFGTLRRLGSGLPGAGVVRAKTGTLTNVSTLVGYLGRDDGTLIIAMMYNGGKRYAARQAQWDLFRKLGAHGVVVPADFGEDTAAGGPSTPQ